MHHLSLTGIASRLSPARFLALTVLLAMALVAALAIPTFAGAQADTPPDGPLPSLPSSSVNEPPSSQPQPSAPTAGVNEPPSRPVVVPDTDQPVQPAEPAQPAEAANPVLLPATGEVVGASDPVQATSNTAANPAVGQLPSTGTGPLAGSSGLWGLAAIPAAILALAMVIRAVGPARVSVRRR